MNGKFDSNTPLPSGAFSAQSEKEKTAIEVLEGMKDDMAENAVEKEDVEAVIKMVKVYRAMH